MSATEYLDRPTMPTPPPPRDSGRIILTVVLALVAVLVAAGMLAVALVAFGRSSDDNSSGSGGFEAETTTESGQASDTDTSSEQSNESGEAPAADANPAAPATDQASSQEADAPTDLGSDADDAENSAAAPVPTGLQPLTLRGMGSVTFGMTVEQAEKALGATMEFGVPASEGCYNASDPTDVTSPLFMVRTTTGDPTDGTVVRIDLGETHKTRAGIHIGSTKAQVLEAYGDRIVASVHPYDSSPGSEYLTYVPNDQADANYRLIIETHADSVVGIRAGLLPEVEWIEGCA